MLTAIAAEFQNLPGREVVFGPGEPVFHFGDTVRSIHFVRQGVVHLVRHQSDGTALILQRAGAGVLLAEASVYSEHYHCDARTEGPAVTWVVARDELLHRLKENGQFAQAWAHHLAQEVQRSRLRAEIMSLKTVSARLNAWLAWHGALPEKGQGSRVAREIGVSPEALYRELANRKGITKRTSPTSSSRS